MSPTTRVLPGPLKRFRDYLREIRRLGAETQALVSAAADAGAAERASLGQQVAHLKALIEAGTAERAAISEQIVHLTELISGRLDALASQQHDARELARSEHRQLVEILRFVHDRAQWRRRQLLRLRSSPEYSRPFEEPQPLISVVIPTYDNHALLRERSMPSVLAQTYQNFEVLVVGDAAPGEAREAVEGFEDPRIRFSNLPYRGPYPSDPETRWLVAGVPAYNEAVRRARGLWIAPLDDDDAFRPHHLEHLLEHATRCRLELAYSRELVHFADGTETTMGCFPPEYGQFGVQASIYHAGLTDTFEYELADAALGLPNDWALCLRMMEAGVRMGMLDEVTVDYYPSRSWTPRWEGDPFPGARTPVS